MLGTDVYHVSKTYSVHSLARAAILNVLHADNDAEPVEESLTYQSNFPATCLHAAATL